MCSSLDVEIQGEVDEGFACYSGLELKVTRIEAPFKNISVPVPASYRLLP